ncbi:MAG: hypothetical protein K0S80_4948 [Neobacillus sp.]|nr:hypothetical protein [Neobacillus sp.]
MWWRIIEFWDWFWFYRRGKVKYNVYGFGNEYNASASNEKISVHNCYGSTPEMAKEIALFRLNKAINREEVEKELISKGDRYELYRNK